MASPITQGQQLQPNREPTQQKLLPFYNGLPITTSTTTDHHGLPSHSAMAFLLQLLQTTDKYAALGLTSST